jgi:hypothetical protein
VEFQRKQYGTSNDTKKKLTYISVIIKHDTEDDHTKKRLKIDDLLEAKRSALNKLLTDFNIMDIMYDYAYKYLKENRPPAELKLFEEMYENKKPKHCHFNYYKNSDGIKVHRDPCSLKSKLPSP